MSDDSYRYTAAFYDHTVPYKYRPDVPFYVELAQAAAGPVLELGCGTGRILLPVARAVQQPVTGLDLSAPMLDVLREQLTKEPDAVQQRVTVVQRDMSDFHLGETFALITVPFRAFQHLITVEEQLAALACVREHLAPGGLFVLDLFNPSLPYLADENRFEEFGEEPEFTMPDGRRVLRRTRIAARDYFRQVQDAELIYYVTHPDGRQERIVHAFPMRYLFRYEAEHLLARAGFAVDAVYADYARTPYGEGAYPGELIFAARHA